MTDRAAILIIGETTGDQLRPVSLELVTAGRRLADAMGRPLVGLLMGLNIGQAAQQFGDAGLDRLLVADHDSLGQFTAGAYTAVATSVIREYKPVTVLIPGTTAGRDYAPRLAARLQTGVAADCVDLTVEEGALVAVRPVLAGRVNTAVNLAGSDPAIVTVRPGSFEKSGKTGATVDAHPVVVELGADDLRVVVREIAQEPAGAVKLEEAVIIVSGGRGLKEPDNFALIEELAEALGAAVGASRAVVDAGW
jgi:electron transfer flavoprotein alpha subunit